MEVSTFDNELTVVFKIQEAQVVFFLVDARTGVSTAPVPLLPDTYMQLSKLYICILLAVDRRRSPFCTLAAC